VELITDGEPRIEVLPALQLGRPARSQPRPEPRFTHRLSRARRYPVEQNLATLPGPARLGRHLDIQV